MNWEIRQLKYPPFFDPPAYRIIEQAKSACSIPEIDVSSTLLYNWQLHVFHC
jgi:hypothetical protein